MLKKQLGSYENIKTVYSTIKNIIKIGISIKFAVIFEGGGGKQKVYLIFVFRTQTKLRKDPI